MCLSSADMRTRLIIRFFTVIIFLYGCTALHTAPHRRAHRHQRSRERRQESPPFILGQADTSEDSDGGSWGPWSEEAPCSRTCGGGVSYQERQCLGSGCSGANRRYFSCNIQNCAPGTDFRSEQCAAYNAVAFEDIHYDWIPYTKADNKCQLNCMPRGERFYYRHQDKVQDGTPCTEDSLDVCVDGQCMPVGCDRLLGSPTKEDVCRVCGGDGSTCTTSTGILDDTNLVTGYNDLLLIPAGATNLKVNERRPSSNYLAIRNQTGHYYLNGNWKIDFPRSLRFAGTVFTYSRKPYGFWAPESITALGPTTEAIYIVLLYQEPNPGIEYAYSVPKGTVHETSPQGYNWQFGDWSECSTTCGTGYQSREVWCALRGDTESRVSSDLCDPTTEPASNQQCSHGSCPPGWGTSAWSPCSVSCGPGGQQSRQVYCTQDVGSGQAALVNESVCTEAGPKPAASQPCGEPSPCPLWHIGPWKPCDRLCGDGKQRRDLHCYSKTEGRIQVLAHIQCGGERPEAEKACNLRPCDGLDWITGEWSGCSDKCGLAIETRTAYCANQKGQAFPDTMCHTYRKPELVRNCTYIPCASQWFASQWSPCSAKCGSGIQTRSVFCATSEDDSIKKVEETKCDPAQKYEDKKDCKVEAECTGEWYYGPYSSCSKPCGGGQMSRKILCLKNNKTVDIKECSMDKIEFTSKSCNNQPCGEDEIMPVEPTQMITEEYSEDCEDEDYDYEEEMTPGSFIKTDSGLDLSTDDGLIALTDKDTTLLTGTDEDEGSGGYSDDLIKVSLSGSSPSSSSPDSSEGTSTVGLMSSTGESTDSSKLASSESSPLASTSEKSEPGTSPGEMSTVSSIGSSVSLDDLSASPVVTSEAPSSQSFDISLADEPASQETSSSPQDTSSSVSLAESEQTESSLSSSSESVSASSEDTSMTSSDDDLTTSSSDPTSTESSSPSSEDVSSTTESDLPSTVEDLSTLAVTGDTSSSVNSSTLVTQSSSDMSTTSDWVSELSTLFISSTPETMSSELSSTSPDASSSAATTSSVSSVTDEVSLSSSSEALVSTTVISASSESSSLGVTESTEGATSESSSPTDIQPLSSASSSVGTESSIEASSTIASTISSPELSSESSSEATELVVTSLTEAIFNVTTPSAIEKALKKEQKMKKCRRRKPKKLKCLTSPFGCCPDNKTEAKGPFGKDCPMPMTCAESEHRCCPDGVSPAKGPSGKGCPPSLCEQTLFGCCPDGYTAATGNDLEGCPVETTTAQPMECSSTQFGCCPDGIISASGPENEGCASCNETEYGCCPDGVSTALGPEMFGCDIEDITISTTESADRETEPIIEYECENATYGCCPDGSTAALGPDNQGCGCANTEFGCCPDGNTAASGANLAGCARACKGGEFGCCDDNITLAHGPNKEGCCLLHSYGCCPDNIRPARGPNFDGCGCEYSTYGCCPDNRTAARGPALEGCGCQYTPHGCCFDNYTPAAGPDFQGCPCYTFQFGCCPDGETTAKGPHLQGCSCEETEFGCCSDGRTPARDASKVCNCAASKYGCCLDGVTEAQGEDFEVCEKKPIHRGEYCSLPKMLGECRNLTIKWYFDMEYGGCSRFWYGNCGGNGNRFSNVEECKATCVEARGKERCYLPKIEGPCKSYYPRWYYDRERKICSQFVYSGCLGNTNRFETREECDQLCGSQQHLDPCEQTVETGPCSGNFTRWYYSKESQSCITFKYGGCKGTQNNFLTESACKTKCIQPGKSRVDEVCSLKADPGPCRGSHVTWFHDARNKRCRQFIYGGCGGNENRFRSRYDCQSLCLLDENDVQNGGGGGQIQNTHSSVREECSLPREKGTCTEKEPKWYFDYSENKCLPFHYSGCGGNDNKFDTRQECEQACPPRIELDTCMLPALEGECQNYTEKFFYDSLRKQCRRFYYGGCGGNGNNFPTEIDCQRRCDQKSLPAETPFTSDMCFLGNEAGTCSGSEIRWYYSSQDGICKQFRYSGCGGNGNRFENRQHCEQSCGSVQDICSLPRVVGPCDGSYRQWHYDQATDTCQAFDYGGCQGNGNRFDTEEQCRSRCVREKPRPLPQVTFQDICFSSVDPGPCLEQIAAWFYEPTSGSCKFFMFGGCEGNANRFVSEEQCERQCGQFKGQEACSNDKEVGVCDRSLEKYYFDPEQQACSQFTYSGCGGNSNRFSTLDECQSICVQRAEPPIPGSRQSSPANQAICSIPAENGTCMESHQRWHYDSRRRECVPFIYTGCGGNLNNFNSFQDCAEYCTSEPKLTDNEIETGESTKERCAEIEARCGGLTGCLYGVERWVDSAGCSACRCHDPCLNNPPECPPAHSCHVELVRDPQTDLTEYRPICRPDTKEGECGVPVAGDGECSQECRSDGDCPGLDKCCYTGCGTACTTPRHEAPATHPPPSLTDTRVEAPVISDRTPDEESEEEGSYVTFNCVARGRPAPSILWYRGSEELQVGNTGGGRYRILENGTLQVVGLEKTDAGVYTCRASNGVQPDATRQYTLTVRDGRRRDASVVGEDGADLVVALDTSAVLTCYAIGWPRPSVTWWQGTRMLPLASELLEQRRDNTLLIRRVRLSALGYYTCQAYNGQGKAASWTVALKVVGPITSNDPNDVTYNQFVLPAPRGLLPPEDRPRPPPPQPTPSPPSPLRADISSSGREIGAGGSLSLVCSTTGEPTPRVTWLKDNLPLSTSERVIVTDNRLLLSNVEVEDSGEYKCVADNGYGTAEVTTNIKVIGLQIHPNCTDSPFLANCKLIIQARYCNHKFYAKFCCKSCTEAGQLPLDGPHLGNLRKKRSSAVSSDADEVVSSEADDSPSSGLISYYLRLPPLRIPWLSSP